MAKLKSNIIANYCGAIWTSLMGIIFIPLYIQFLGMEAYGLVGFYATLLALTGPLGNGLGLTLNRELARLAALHGKIQESWNLIRTMEIIFWSAMGLLAVVIICLSYPIGLHWLNVSQLSVGVVQESVQLMGISLALLLPFTLYSGGLNGLERQVQLNWILAGSATIRGIGAVLVLWLISPTLKAFFLWQIIASVATTFSAGICLSKSMSRAPGRVRFDSKMLSAIRWFGSAMIGITALWTLIGQIDKVIVSRMLPLEEFGYYALAWVLAAALVRVFSPIREAIFPRLTALVSTSDEEELTRLYHTASQLMTVLVVPIGITAAFFSYEILLIWTGDPAISARTCLISSLLVIGQLINGLCNLPYSLQIAYGWTSLILWFNLACLAAGAPLTIVLTRLYGTTGAAIVWVAINIFHLVLLVPLMHRRILKGEAKRWLFADTGLPVLAVAVTTYVFWHWAPQQLTRPGAFIYLSLVAFISTISAVLTTPLIRTRLLDIARKALSWS